MNPYMYSDVVELVTIDVPTNTPTNSEKTSQHGKF